MELKLCHIYPDLLNLYGDRGNVLCLQKRLLWRGIDVSVTELPMGQCQPFSVFDLFFIGGGQDFDQQVLMDDLKGKKRLKFAVQLRMEKHFSPSAEGISCLETGTVPGTESRWIISGPSILKRLAPAAGWSAILPFSAQKAQVALKS